MENELIKADHFKILNSEISFTINERQLTAITGPNKSGKTTLGKILSRQLPNNVPGILWNIESSQIKFSDYTAENYSFHYSNYYYQQRYNAFDNTTVRHTRQFLRFDPVTSFKSGLFTRVLSDDILEKRLTELSSGETRKVILLKNLFEKAEVYILDHPFTGLDKDSIVAFMDIFNTIAKEYGRSLVLLLHEIPEGISFDQEICLKSQEIERTGDSKLNRFTLTPSFNFDIAFQIQHQKLELGTKTLICDVSWTIRKGEKWLLRGKNGSGKSTLMSLLNADNPMAYRLGITLFDRKRGTGESIWDIKSRIGFISPEIQLYWDHDAVVQRIVLSGFMGTMLPNRKVMENEWAQYNEIMRILELKSLENKAFGHLSTGEKRMVTIARAMVRNPPLLILDEPFQGLDQENFKKIHSFFSACADENRTIIQIAHLDKEILPGIDHRAVIRDKKFLLFP